VKFSPTFPNKDNDLSSKLASIPLLDLIRLSSSYFRDMKKFYLELQLDRSEKPPKNSSKIKQNFHILTILPER